MPNTHETLSSLFTDIANAIRAKKGESSDVKYVADNFPAAIAALPSGGASVSGYTSYATQSVRGSAVDPGLKTRTKTFTKDADALFYVFCFSAYSHLYTVDTNGDPSSDNAAAPAVLCNSTIVVDASGTVVARFGDNTQNAKLELASTTSSNMTVKGTYRALAGMYVSYCFSGGYLTGS